MELVSIPQEQQAYMVYIPENPQYKAFTIPVTHYMAYTHQPLNQAVAIQAAYVAPLYHVEQQTVILAPILWPVQSAVKCTLEALLGTSSQIKAILAHQAQHSQYQL